MNWKIEVVTIPVSDLDRSIEFYAEKVGFNVDIDFRVSDEVRLVQLTPPGSACSIHLGKNTVNMAPGSIDGVFLVVPDVSAAEVLGAPDLGQLATGFRADIVAVPGNPVEDVALMTKVNCVMKDGTVYVGGNGS